MVRHNPYTPKDALRLKNLSSNNFGKIKLAKTSHFEIAFPTAPKLRS